jgi:hypothetical protein
VAFEIVEQIPDYIEIRLSGQVTGEDVERLCDMHAPYMLVDLSGLEVAEHRPRSAGAPHGIGTHTEEHIAFYAPGTRPYAAAQQIAIYLGRCARLDIFVNRDEALFWLAH